MNAAPLQTGGPLLVTDVRVQRGDFLLDLPRLTFSGGVTGLVGPNGAGKTTTMEAIAGDVALAHGEVVIGGHRIAAFGHRLPEVIARVPDDLPGVAGMRVREHLRFLASLYPGWDADYAAALCDRFQLTMDRRLSELSRGNRGKLAFVSAEAPRPPVLLLDEPTSGLDPFVRQQFLDVVAEATRERPERIIVFSTHLLEDLAQLADELVLLAGGRIVRTLDRERVREWRRTAAGGRGAGLAAYLAELGDFT